ncbi:Zf-UBP-domain-containing protein [Pleurostoma richardsiae]|uniref:Zf-UBP-domain-containing protein n=1 Tax=Pleurostoma richardsiae TaxID=41990 RepID=A0AA38VX92_9PEZI|nr:Zf-UBP-domain-containing protein [Pleurostoma richardsiae]
MPSYFYHLKFELYPSPDPSSSKQQTQDEHIWLPTRGASIFDDLPSHPRRKRDARPSKTQTGSQSSTSSTISGGSAAHDPGSRPRPPRVIDCGASRAPVAAADDDRKFEFLTERQWRERSKSFPPPGFAAGLGPRTATRDWRFGRLNIESFDMAGDAAHEGKEKTSPGGYFGSGSDAAGDAHAAPAASLGPNLGGAGQATRARYVPLETKNTEVGWGIVHLYRESEESRALSAPPPPLQASGGEGEGPEEDDCTILCIPAVPSYLSPSDFLGFVGEKWRGDVTHYRMVMTSRMNRYMVLMKFRDNKRAREWRKEFDGKVFNSMEAEICHVTFIKSITVEQPSRPRDGSSNIGGDPFASSSSGAVVNSLKPLPPPTPNLIELPTCPVCLERMDDTTGLMTIICQHVFHCTCLQTWKGSGCPVCRATNPIPASDPDNPYSRPFGSGPVSNMCSVCDTTDDLWICLICGNVGCGRYKGGHAKEHWKDTAHSFSLELETQHVWDYAGDMWVHRLIRDKGDGKVVELPSHGRGAAPPNGQGGDGGGGGDTDTINSNSNREDADVVPRAKLDRIGLEYTHLLTSQLESQRVYFEEMVNKAADKAAKASAAAEAAAQQAQAALRELSALRAEHAALKEQAVPALEREVERERRRADKAAELARGLGRSLQEEKRVGEGLMERIGHITGELGAVRAEVERLRGENEELKETNRDLTMFISGQEKLRELEEEGKVEQGEVEAGTVSVPEEKKKGKGKGKGRR